MYYKKLLMTTKIPEDKLMEIFIPYLTYEYEFEERKDNDITLFFIIDNQNLSRDCLIKIINNMIKKNSISRNDVEYIVNHYKKYNFNIDEFY